ncbi:MAG: polysaccharide biosynthesis C-terminal domain-containing protein, partial [Deltaproteobacteria bacterium]|nr:polysaccharide biosynthesis C-terminal domain-containing protein [Deltaproteobacteria bacterium]MBW2537279.1 polysaccharide biosynthesis C-terminal domain-containing protein [Deltaproteobacteria bacterium]
MSSLERQRLVWKHRPFKELCRLAWPISVSMLSYSLMTLVDTLLVARLGASALAGVSVGGVVAFTLLCFGWGLLRSVKVLVSQAVGAGKHGRVPAIVGAGLLLALAFGLANVAVGQLLSTELHRVMATAASAAQGKAYLDVRVLGAPLFLVAAALREARHGVGDTRLPMRAAVVANLVNIGLDWVFIFGLSLGVAGAAWASVIAHGVDAALLLAATRRCGSSELGGAAARSGWSAVWISCVYMGAAGLLFAVFRHQFVGFFSDDPEVVRLGA